MTNEGKSIDLEAVVGEYLRTTKGLRYVMMAKERHYELNDAWCLEQAECMAAGQNHTDADIMSIRNTGEKSQKVFYNCREYDEERVEKLNDRLSKIEKMLARLALVNMAKMIENAMTNCIAKMVEQVTDQVVGKLEKLA